MSFYGPQQWDPKLISSQIVAIQSCSYVSLGCVLFVLHSLSGSSISMDQFFKSNLVDLSTDIGWIISVATMINSVFGAVMLFVVVERAKKCLDFAFTTHLLHFMACYLYDGFPLNWEWWILNIVSLVVMAVVGEYLCSRLELREIKVSDFLSLKSDRNNIV